MVHEEKSALAGKIVKIKEDAVHPTVFPFGGSAFHVEDWWDRVYGMSWKNSTDNVACYVYALRNKILPQDDEVLYGKIGPFGHLVHMSELEP